MRGLVPVVLALLLAGCSSPPPSNVFTATGSQPVVFAGYDYAGATAEASEGTFRVSTDHATDAGEATASFTHLGQPWVVTFARFQEGRPFHEGGVRANFREHGASGNGDALLPEFTALSAGWGTGTITVGGQPFVDPATGLANVSLHYMVSDGAVRDPASRMVTKADGATPYDPATPGDARVAPGPRQFLLNVQSLGTPPPDALQVVNDTIQAPNYNRSHPFEVNQSNAAVAVNLTIAPAGAAPVAPGVATFLLLDPAGQPQGRYEYAPSPGTLQGATTRFDVPAPVANGTWSLQVMSTAASLAYGAEIAVDYPEALFLHVVYTQVAIEAQPTA